MCVCVCVCVRVCVFVYMHMHNYVCVCEREKEREREREADYNCEQSELLYSEINVYPCRFIYSGSTGPCTAVYTHNMPA